MSERIVQSIRDRIKIDALDAYREAQPDRAIHEFTITDSSVVTAPHGFTAHMIFQVRTNAWLFSNTSTHRLDIEYDSEGRVLKKGKVETVSRFGISLE